jgi:hypothetical protein
MDDVGWHAAQRNEEWVVSSCLLVIASIEPTLLLRETTQSHLLVEVGEASLHKMAIPCVRDIERGMYDFSRKFGRNS